MSKRKMLPPIDPLPEELVLVRRPFTQRLVVHFENGDTYKLSVQNTETFLKLLGCSTPSDVTALVWNFHAVHYNVLSEQAMIVPLSVVEEIMGDGYASRVAQLSTGVE